MAIDFPADWQLPTFDLCEFKPRSTRYAVCIPVINEGQRILTQLAEMQRLNIPVTYLYYGDEGHGFRRPDNRR